MTNAPEGAAPSALRIPLPIRVAVTVGCFAWLSTRIPLADARAVVDDIRISPLVIAVVLIVGGQILRAARTCALVGKPLSPPYIGPMLRMQMVAFLPGMISPAKAGELLKVELMHREWGITRLHGTGAFVAERVADVLVLGALAVWGFYAILQQRIPSSAFMIVGVLVMVGVAGFFALRGRFTERLSAARQAAASVPWGVVGITTVLYWSVVVAIVAAFAHGVAAHPPIHTLFGVVPLSLLTALLPISFGGFGVREGAMTILFQETAVGCTEAQAIGISLLYDVLGLGIPAVMGMAYTLAGRSEGTRGA